MATTFNTLLDRYRFSTMLMKIIIVNAVVFVALRVAVIIGFFGGMDDPSTVLRWVEMPSDPVALLHRPWTVVTYMFAQYDVLHILFNMLWLYWFGVIFLSLSTGRRMLALYVYGGLAGAMFYLAAYNALPVFHGVNGLLVGSSGAVIAVVVATAVMAPDYKMYLMFIGGVSLKWVAAVTIGLDLIGITGSNAGGHIAHLGGAVAGAVYALALRRGVDITTPFCRVADAVVNAFSAMRRPRKPSFHAFRGASSGQSARRPAPHADSAADQAALDAILDKIKKSGYSSLTTQERKRLFDVSSRIK